MSVKETLRRIKKKSREAKKEIDEQQPYPKHRGFHRDQRYEKFYSIKRRVY